MKKYFISVLVFGLISLNICNAANLDGPVKQETAITVKSELERADREGYNAKSKGDDAVFELAMINPIKYPSTPAAYVQSCDEQLAKVIFENEKNHTLTNAYCAGIYFMFWENAASKLKNDAFNSPTAKRYFVEFRKRQKELDIDNKTLASFYFKDKYYTTELEPILNKWIEQYEK